ncbi:hypothetical protein [Ensifer canadensis]
MGDRKILSTIVEACGAHLVLSGGDERLVQIILGDLGHPRNPSRIDKGENKGKMSSAAGRYQIRAPTWEPYAKKMQLENFSPHNQDRAGWKIAQDAYRRVTKGRDLDEELMSADSGAIKAAGSFLAPTWTSLHGGKEQRMTPEQFLDTYLMNLQAREGRMLIPQGRPFEDRLSVMIPPNEQDGPLQKALAGGLKSCASTCCRLRGRTSAPTDPRTVVWTLLRRCLLRMLPAFGTTCLDAADP